MGRNEEKVVKIVDDVKRRLLEADIEVVIMTGDEDKDVAALEAFGKADLKYLIQRALYRLFAWGQGQSNENDCQCRNPRGHDEQYYPEG